MAEPACWCGAEDVRAFSSDYLRCAACETLISRCLADLSATYQATDDTAGFYGKAYWFERQRQVLGQETVVERARSDLSGRCLYWLRRILAYKPPPGLTLDVGGAHGGLAALLDRAGFQATCLELSPWLVAFGQRHFGVDMRLGRLEDQDIPPTSLDLITLMDVAEHLPEPLKTLKICANILRSNGLLMLQTPAYPEGTTHAALEERQDPFLQMLIPDEHLYLFSRSAIKQLLTRAGFGHVRFEQALFPYDMYLVAGEEPSMLQEPAVTPLDDTPNSVLVQTLLDLYHHNEHLSECYAQADQDRRLRAEQSAELEARLIESETDRAARLEQITDLTASLRESEADRAARLEQITNLTANLRESEAGQAAHLEQITNLTANLRESETNQAAQLEQINKLTTRLRKSETNQAAQLKHIREFDAELKQTQAKLTRSETTLAAKKGEVQNLAAALKETKSELAQAQVRNQDLGIALHEAETDRALRMEQIETLSGMVQHQQNRQSDLEELLRRVRSSRFTWALRHIGLWRWLEQPSKNQPRPHVAVDLTPLLPGAENGGAKILAIALVEYLARLAPAWQFTLLTRQSSHEELARLENRNIRRHLTLIESGNLINIARKQLAALSRRSLLAHLEADLLFCPFTAPFYHRPDTPTVCLVHDLQFTHYPQFFTASERAERERHLADTCAKANRIVCVSEHVRRNLIEHAGLPEERISVIHTCLPRRTGPPDATAIAATLAHHGLKNGDYFLYPANFWPHKNHAMLLTALGMLVAKRPDLNTLLVCTGAPGPGRDAMRNAAQCMGLAQRTRFPGFVAEQEYAALLSSCRALIFPSLHEGFGMPLVEAMAAGRPILCAETTSLPEVAGEAALYFDPRKPDTIVSAMERLLEEHGLASTLAARGQRRLAAFASPERMGMAYLRLFETTLTVSRGNV